MVSNQNGSSSRSSRAVRSERSSEAKIDGRWLVGSLRPFCRAIDSDIESSARAAILSRAAGEGSSL